MSRLTRTVFSQGIGLIASRWKDVPAEVSLVWAKWLSANDCTAEEFIAGVSRAVAEDEFSPSAKRILELGRPEAPAVARAGDVFARVLELRRYQVPHGLRLALEDVRRELGPAAVRAVVAIGGASRLTGLTDESRPFVERDFAKAFAAFDADERARITSGHFLAEPLADRIDRAGGPARVGALTPAVLARLPLPDQSTDADP